MPCQTLLARHLILDEMVFVNDVSCSFFGSRKRSLSLFCTWVSNAGNNSSLSSTRHILLPFQGQTWSAAFDSSISKAIANDLNEQDFSLVLGGSAFSSACFLLVHFALKKTLSFMKER